jgi:hypothetical protein
MNLLEPKVEYSCPKHLDIVEVVRCYTSAIIGDVNAIKTQEDIR